MGEGANIGSIIVPIAVVDVSKGSVASFKTQLQSIVSAIGQVNQAQKKLSSTTAQSTQVEKGYSTIFASSTQNMHSYVKAVDAKTKASQKELAALIKVTNAQREKAKGESYSLSFSRKTDKLTGTTTESFRKQNKVITVNSKNFKDLAYAGAKASDVGHKLSISTETSNKSMKGFMGTVLQMNSKLTNFRWALVNIGFVFGTVFAMAKPFIEVTKQAMAFEHELKKIQSVTGAMPDVTGKFILAAREGRPFSTTEVSEGFLEFSKAGFSAEETTSSLIPILNLAQAGMMDVGRAASLTAQVMHQFSNEGVTAIEVVDTLSSVADLTRASEEGLGSALGYVGTIAAEMNQSMESTIQLLGVLTNKGLNASKAGTGLRQVYASLMSPSAKAQKALDKLGVSMVDASGDIKPLTQFLRQLKVSLDGLSEGTKQNILGDIFEIRALAGVEAFMSELDKSITGLDEFSVRADRAGYSMVKAMVQSTSSVNRLKSAWNDFKVGFLDAGDIFNEGMKSSIEGLDTIGKILGFYAITLVEIIALAGRFLSIFGEIPKAVTYGSLIIQGKFKEAAEYANNNKTKKDAAWLFLGLKDKTELETVVDEIRSVQEMLSGEGIFQTLDTGTDVLVGFETISNFAKVLETNFGKAGISIAVLYNEFSNAEERAKNLSQELSTVNTKVEEYGKDAEGKSLAPEGQINKQTRLLKEYNDEQNKLLKLKTQIGKTAIEIELDRKFVDNIVEGGDVLTNFIEKIDLLKIATAQSGDMTKVFDSLLGLDKIHESSNKLQTLFDETFKSISTTALSAFKKGSISETIWESIFGSVTDMMFYIKQIEAVENSIASLKETKKDLQTSIKDTNILLTKEKDKLKDLQDQLSEVNKTIAELSKPRFAGQLDIEILIQNIDREIKKRKLADVGISDSYTFLQQSLQAAKGGYDSLFESIENVTGATKNSQSSYEAWQQTVQEFIRDTVKSGNILGMNVSGAVNKFSTLLLSTSQFNSETDKTSDTLSYLKDAYDIYYGGMTDDVQNAVKAHKEEATGVFNSSGAVISALQTQWTEQDKLTSAVEAQKEEVKTLEEELTGYKTELDETTTSIDAQTLSIIDLIKKYKELVDLLATTKTDEINVTATTADEAVSETPGFNFNAITEQQLQSGQLVGQGKIDMFESGLPQGEGESKLDVTATALGTNSEEGAAGALTSASNSMLESALQSELQWTQSAFKIDDSTVKTIKAALKVGLGGSDLSSSSKKLDNSTSLLSKMATTIISAIATIISKLNSPDKKDKFNVGSRTTKDGKSTSDIRTYEDANKWQNGQVGDSTYGGAGGDTNSPYDSGNWFKDESDKYNDFVMRPGQGPVSFSPQDTIVGVKDISQLSNLSDSNSNNTINIGDINVSTQSGNAQDIANTIARTIKNELKTK